jgi:hypothetical protein
MKAIQAELGVMRKKCDRFFCQGITQLIDCVRSPQGYYLGWMLENPLKLTWHG